MDDFDLGFDAGLAAAEAIAVKWRDENRAACAKARKSLSPASRDMADMLDGAAIECNAIAGEIRKLVSGTPTRSAETTGSVGEANGGPAVEDRDALNSSPTSPYPPIRG